MKKQFLLFTFYFLLFTACLMPLKAQVSPQNNGTASTTPVAAGSTYTIDNFTVPAGINVALLIATRNASSATVTNINFNGTDYTTENIGTGDFGAVRSEIWAIPLGNIGSAINNQTITVTISSADPQARGGFAATFNNVNQTTPANNFTQESNGDNSIDVTSSSNDAVIDLIGAGATPNYTVDGSQVALVNNAIVHPNGAGIISGSYEMSTGASTTMSWTNSGGSGVQLHVGANIQWDGVNLPVEMTNFKAWQSEENVELAWTTASEVNNEGFEIEQKAGDTEWRFLDFMPGSGTSFEEQSYSFLHTAPSRGLNYYRLKQLDFDGGSEYSPVVSVQLAGGSKQLAVSPNPVTSGTLKLSFPDTDFESGFLDLFDAKGVKVLSQPVTNQTTDLDVRFLAKGIYWLGMRIDGEAFWEKVVLK